MHACVYSGTFDILTLGHVDIVNRCEEMFDKVYVVILNNINKNNIFTIEKRVELARKVFDSPKVEVLAWEGLLVDFCQEHYCNIIVRGLRNEEDYLYETKLDAVNKALNPHIETIFLTSNPKYVYISSSMVKEVLAFNGAINSFVPAQIIEEVTQIFNEWASKEQLFTDRERELSEKAGFSNNKNQQKQENK